MSRTALHGLISLRELRALGVPDPTVRSRVSGGRWYRLYRGVLSVVHPSLLRPEGRWRAAVLACGEGAALAAREAASLHGLRRGTRTRIDVIVPRARSPRHSGIEVHRSATLRRQDVTRVKGIAVTTIARTIYDCAGLLSRDELERLVGEAEIQAVLDERALREQIALSPNTVAAKRLRELLDSYEYDRGAVLNQFEQDLHHALRAAGAPAPLKNRSLVLCDGGPPLMPDFQWPEQKVVLNADGFKYHRSRRKFEHDIESDQRMVDDDWLPMRVTYRQAKNPRKCERVIPTVVRKLQGRSPGPFPGAPS